MSNITRSCNRLYDELREIQITRSYTKYADGSVLYQSGNTMVLCSVIINQELPAFIKNNIMQSGWLTAEYSMLPSATHIRSLRERSYSKPNSRSLEISRLIGRSLRACVDLEKLAPYNIIVDCDVIMADGGTRVASINGAFIALYDAITKLLLKINSDTVNNSPLHNLHINDIIKTRVAAVSIGVFLKDLLVDLEYKEDSSCDADFNIVMNDDFSVIEFQGSNESGTNSLNKSLIYELLNLSENAISKIFHIYNEHKIIL